MTSTGPSRAVRDLVLERDSGCCVECGTPRGLQLHHRLPRRAGGTRWDGINTPPNLLTVCLHSHAWIESNRSEAYAAGWLVPTSTDPGHIPVLIAGLGAVFLTESGGYEPVPHVREVTA